MGAAGLCLLASTILLLTLPASVSAAPHPDVCSVPAARSSMAWVWDPADGYWVMFGGFNTSASPTSYGDTWTYTPGISCPWAQLTLGTTPSPRNKPYFAWDAADGYVVLYGGETEAPLTYLSDTWSFRAGAWTHVTTTGTSPGLQDSGAMTYDPADGYVLAFGGSLFQTFTWTYVSGAWTKNTVSAPGIRDENSMTWDTTDGYALMYGGLNNSSALSDSWSFVHGVWTKVTTSGTTPRGSWDVWFGDDAADGYVVAFGGTIGLTTSVSNTTSKYKAGVWTNLTSTLTTSPTAVSDPGGRMGNTGDGLFGGVKTTYSSQTFFWSNNRWTATAPVNPAAPSGGTALGFVALLVPVAIFLAIAVALVGASRSHGSRR